MKISKQDFSLWYLPSIVDSLYHQKPKVDRDDFEDYLVDYILLDMGERNINRIDNKKITRKLLKSLLFTKSDEIYDFVKGNF